MIILDTSVLFAYVSSRDPQNAKARSVIDQNLGHLAVSPYVIAELDYFVTARMDLATEIAVLAGLAGGEFELPTITSADLLDCARIIERYSDHKIGVADASLVVLAHRYQTRKIATFDRRHFSMLKTFEGESFELLP